MRILLTGGGGFVGSSLNRVLSERGHEVAVADLPVAVARIPGALPLDIGDDDSVNHVIQTVKPDCVVHLAAQPMVQPSWTDPAATLNTNITGAVRLFMAVQKFVPQARFIFIGSGEEYGIGCMEDAPFTEESVCRPQNPYAVSKHSAGQLLELLAERYGVDFIHVRPFNHFGPGQREGFVVADFCAQIARIEAGLQAPEMSVGCLEAKRDLMYIDDVLGAYVLLAECKEHKYFTYNVCSGVSRPVQELLDILLAASRCKISQTVDPAKYRKPQNPILCASHDRLTAEFGWLPQTAFTAGLEKTLDFWRKKIRSN